MSVVSRPAATGAPSIASLLPALDSVAPIAEEAVQALLKVSPAFDSHGLHKQIPCKA